MKKEDMKKIYEKTLKAYFNLREKGSRLYSFVCDEAEKNGYELDADYIGLLAVGMSAGIKQRKGEN